MGELQQQQQQRPRSSNSKKRKEGKSRSTVGSGKTKERVSKAKSSNNKRQSERFHGVEDATPRVSHLRKTVSDSRVAKAKPIPIMTATTAATGDINNNTSKNTGKGPQRLAEAASAVTTQLSSALTKLADITTDFLYSTKSDLEDAPALVETSMESTTPTTPRSIRLQLETTFSTLTSELEALTERNKVDASFNSTDFNNNSNVLVAKSPKKSALKKQKQQVESRRIISVVEEKKMESPQDSFSDIVTPDRSFDSQQSNMSPPPQLMDGRVSAKHQSSNQKLHRPVPVVKQLKSLLEESYTDVSRETEASCEQQPSTPRRVVYPEREDEYAYMKTTPMARMRHLEAQQAVTVHDKMNDVTPHRVKSQEQVKKEKQRKWRRRMKLAEKKREKELRELYDDATATSAAVNTTATAPVQNPCRDGLRAVFVETTTSPVRMFQQMIRTRCGILGDALSFDSADEEESEGSQDSEELVTTEDEEEGSFDTVTTSNPSPRESPPKSTSSSPLPIREEESPASESRASITPEERTAAAQLLSTVAATNLTDLDVSEIFADDFSVKEPITPRIELNDKSFIKAFIMELTKEGVPLLWHKEQPKANSFSRPCQVMSYLAGGSKGPSGVFEGPRLLWVMSDGASGDSIALFDIRSLEKASPLQLQEYPFAIPGRSMVVRGNMDQEWVFEAPNEGEARRFIHGMRWVVARLAFNLIIGNLDVCCELLNVTKDNEERKHPPSSKEEAQWVKAMNEVTHQLVEKSVFQTAE